MQHIVLAAKSTKVFAPNGLTCTITVILYEKQVASYARTICPVPSPSIPGLAGTMSYRRDVIQIPTWELPKW